MDRETLNLIDRIETAAGGRAALEARHRESVEPTGDCEDPRFGAPSAPRPLDVPRHPVEPGTEVRVRTVNGGEIVGELVRTYVPTFDAALRVTVERPGGEPGACYETTIDGAWICAVHVLPFETPRAR